MSNEKALNKTVRLNAEAYEQLRVLQQEFAKKVGFVPSLTQIVEYLASKEMKEREETK